MQADLSQNAPSLPASRWPWPIVAPPAIVEANKRTVHDFATIERGNTAVLILKTDANMKAPVSAQWLPAAIELCFEEPLRRIILRVPAKFRSKWTDKLYLVLYNGEGDIVKGAIKPSDATAVPMRKA